MATKIIRYGDKKILTCPICSCVFRYEEEDIIVDDYGRNEIHHSVICPYCNEKLRIKPTF